jgi:3,4-dihydroxy 2-butanone 4-phosphate synthase/GTP cyclohydrolase II
VLVRVHEPLSLMDLLDCASPHSWPLPTALATLQAEGRGAAVLLNCGDATAEALLDRLLPPSGRGVVPTARESTMDLRTYGVGAQIVRELGIQRRKLLGSPRRMPSMAGYGLEVTGFVAAPNSTESTH